MSEGPHPFLNPSPLPYRLPDFAAIRDEHYRPAFEAGMAEQRAEVEAILATPENTVETTLVAFERSGRVLDRVGRVFFGRAGAHTTPAIEELQQEIAPELAAHADAIALDERLFARIDDLHARRDTLGLDPESLRLLERKHTDAVRAGARLDAAGKDRLRALNGRISRASAEFGVRLLAGANAAALHVTDLGELAGLTPDGVAAAADAARRGGFDDGYLLTLVLPSGQPTLSALRRRDVRERLHRASVGRGLGGEHDTRDLVLELARLRAERAVLLGYPDHASYVAADNVAGSAEDIAAMLARLSGPATANADAEAEELRALAAAEGHELAPWDWAYLAERVRKERYAVDAAALRPYFELDAVLERGVFAAATALYGLRFTARPDLSAYHPDVRLWEVADEAGPIGLYGLDPYARPTKRGGAWMNQLVAQSGLLGTRPVVMNTLNIGSPADGEPTLLTMDEVRTLFHEFGHALHGLFSDVHHPSLAGLAVPRDFVEFPSQVNEMWLADPGVLAGYAVHHVTGEPLPAEALEKLLAAQAYGEGFATTEYLAAAALDQAWHRLSPEAAAAIEDVEAFETAALERAGLAHPLVPPRYRTTYFNHVWGGGYSAGYYSYIWSEVLDADTVEWFAEHGGLRRENGDRFRAALLSRGGAVDPMTAYRDFRGRDPEIGPLLERRGLTGVS